MGGLLRGSERGKCREAQFVKTPCICRISAELCPIHGREMDDEDRLRQLTKAWKLFDSVELASLDETIDDETIREMAAILSGDSELPHEFRDFLSRAMLGTAEHWELVWKPRRSGPRRTRARVLSKRRRDELIYRDALFAADDIRAQRTQVEPAIAELMERHGITRARAYEALREVRQGMNLVKAFQMVPESNDN